MRASDVITVADLDRYLVENRRELSVKCLRAPRGEVPAAYRATIFDGAHGRHGYGQTILDAICDAEECLDREVALEAEAIRALDGG